VWGEDGRPNNEMKIVTLIIHPTHFGYVGCQLLFANMYPSLVARSFAVILIPVLLRGLMAFIVTPSNKFTIKQRLFIGICWLPKATVQATISGLFLQKAKAIGDPTLIEYGHLIQTVGLMAILICAPLGSILISTTGDYLLDGPEKPAEINDDKKKIKGADDLDLE
jgi:hypothetical protein